MFKLKKIEYSNNLIGWLGFLMLLVYLLTFLIPIATAQAADQAGFSATDPGSEPGQDPQTKFIYDPVKLTNQGGDNPLSSAPAGPVDSEGNPVDPNRVIDPEDLPETQTDTDRDFNFGGLGYQDSTFVPGRSTFADPNVRLTGTTLGIDNVCVDFQNEQVTDANGNTRTVQYCADYDPRYRTRLTWLGERSPRCQGIPGATFHFDESIPGYQGTITVTDLLDDESGETKTYRLECYGDDGELNPASYTVGQGASQPDSVTVSIQADRTSLIRGQSTRIHWNSSSALRCLLNGDQVPFNGSRRVTPNANTTYVLRCSGLGGSARDSVTIRVNDPPPPPEFNVTLNVPSVITNMSGQVSWSTNLQADSCDLWARRPHSGRPNRFTLAWKSNLPGSGNRAVSSFFPVGVEGPYVFEIECHKAGFDNAFASKQTEFVRKQSSSSGSCPPGTHVVIAFPRNRCEPDSKPSDPVDPPLVDLEGNDSVKPGASFTLGLSVDPAASCSYSASGAISGSGSLGTVNGSRGFGQMAPNVTSPTSVTYRVDCTANGKSGSDSHRVNITPEPALNVSVSASPSPVRSGDFITATVNVSPVAASCTYQLSGAMSGTGNVGTVSGSKRKSFRAPNVNRRTPLNMSATCRKSGYKSDSGSTSVTVEPVPEPKLTINVATSVFGAGGNRFRRIRWTASVPGSTCRIWDDFGYDKNHNDDNGNITIPRPNEGDSDGWIQCASPKGQKTPVMKIF
ncbi:hypothetical protein [Methylohalobius crimeensis]|uniref:hypothetical protein n=1 Tax=Methylohalobius crimeensis TaxID=244365 RepID=UPI00041CAD76|nr:hypothetical protein [Methylohalobius crimeensis]